VSTGQRGRDSAERPTQRQRSRHRSQSRPQRAQQRQHRGQRACVIHAKGNKSDAEGSTGCAVPERADVESYEAGAEARRANAVLQHCWRGFRGTCFLNTYFQIERYYCRLFFSIG